MAENINKKLEDEHLLNAAGGVSTDGNAEKETKTGTVRDTWKKDWYRVVIDSEGSDINDVVCSSEVKLEIGTRVRIAPNLHNNNWHVIEILQ